MVNVDRSRAFYSLIFYADLVGMLILFTKISRFHHENPQLLRHPIKFAIVDSSATPTVQLDRLLKPQERIFVGVRSKPASELQNDKKIELTDKEVFLPCHFTC